MPRRYSSSSGSSPRRSVSRESSPQRFPLRGFSQQQFQSREFGRHKLARRPANLSLSSSSEEFSPHINDRDYYSFEDIDQDDRHELRRESHRQESGRRESHGQESGRRESHGQESGRRESQHNQRQPTAQEVRRVALKVFNEKLKRMGTPAGKDLFALFAKQWPTDPMNEVHTNVRFDQVYRDEMMAKHFDPNSRPKPRKKKKQQGDATKKPRAKREPSAYNLFVKDFSHRNPGLKGAELMRSASAKWGKMDSTQKAKWTP